MRYPASAIGRRFGRLVVESEAPRPERGRGRRVTCRCDCGQSKTVYLGHAASGRTQSCGCLQREGVTTHGMTNTPTYKTWEMMIQRCTNQKYDGFGEYGGRGIAVCERWRNSFEDFLADMGLRPSGTTLDRKEVNGDYEPGNCRWATQSEQMRNTRRTKLDAVDVVQIRWLVLDAGLSRAAVGQAFGISGHYCGRVVAREFWGDVA